MAYNIKGITVKINGDATDLEKELNKVKRQATGLDTTMRRLKSSIDKVGGLNGNATFKSLTTYQDLLKTKVANLNSQLSLQRNALSGVKGKYDEVATSLSMLNAKHGVTNETMLKAIGNQKELTRVYGADAKQVTDLNKKLTNYGQQMTALQARIETTRNSMVEFGTQVVSTNPKLASQYFALKRVSDGFAKVSHATKALSITSGVAIAGAIASTVSFEDAFTGVTKTVSGTPKQLQHINNGLKQLSVNTASSYEELAHYAELAGQMGVATKSVLGFTKTVAMLNDTTNLVGDEGAQKIAKFANIMVETEKQTNKYYSRVGSTIVDLGNKFSTTELNIMNTSMRLATAGRQVGFNSQEVLGLSTAISSLGITATAGGSAMSKMLKRIQIAVSTGNDDLQKFASVSGMTAQQFQKAWGEDAAGAFGKFIKGIGKTKDVTKTMNELGITEIRLSNAMGALAQNSDVYDRAIETARKAYSDNTAMVTEAEKRYATLKSQLIQTWNAIKIAGDAIGQSLTPTLSAMLKVVRDVAMGFTKLDSGTRTTISQLLLLGVSISPVSFAFSKLTSGYAGLIRAFTGGNAHIIKFVTAMGLVNTSSGNAIVSISDLVSAMRKGELATADGATSMSKLTKETVSSIPAVSKASSAVKQGASSVREYAKSTASSVTNISNFRQVAQRGASTMKNLASATLASIPTITKVGVVAGVSAVAILELVNHFKGLGEATDESMRANELWYRQLASSVDAIETTSQSVSKLTRSANKTIATYQANTRQAQSYVETLERLIPIENKTTTQKLQIKHAVEQLNTLYPKLKLSVDESTGAIADETGQLISNNQALEENIKRVQEASKQEAYVNAISELNQALVEQKMEYDDLASQIDYARKMQKEYVENGEWDKYDAVTEKLEKMRTEINKSSKELIEAQKRVLESANEMDTGGLTKIGDSLIQSFNDATTTANSSGVKISKKFTEGIEKGMKDGSISVGEAVNYVASLMTLNNAIENGKLAGTNITAGLVSGIINNSKSVTDATNRINNLLTFQNAIQTAQLDGKKIPASLAEGVASGKIDVQDAIRALQTMSGKELNKWIKKQTTEASEGGKKVGKAYGEGGKKEAKKAGKDTSNAYGTSLLGAMDKVKPKVTAKSTSIATAFGSGKATARKSGLGIISSLVNGLMSGNALTFASQHSTLVGTKLGTGITTAVTSGASMIHSFISGLKTENAPAKATNESNLTGTALGSGAGNASLSGSAMYKSFSDSLFPPLTLSKDSAGNWSVSIGNEMGKGKSNAGSSGSGMYSQWNSGVFSRMSSSKTKASSDSRDVGGRMGDGRGRAGSSGNSMGQAFHNPIVQFLSRVVSIARSRSNQIGSNLGSGAGNASRSGDLLGASFENPLTSHIRSALSTVRNAVNSIKSSIASAVKYASENVITVTKRVVTKSSKKDLLGSIASEEVTGLGMSIAERGVQDSVSPYLQPLSNSLNTVTSALGYGTTTGRAGSISVVELSGKIDNLIDALENTTLTINLQPQSLDGEVITDKVTEITNIRELLNNYGKGGA